MERALAWCSLYGLPAKDEELCSDCGGECLRLETFQRETIIRYLLFRLWKALVEWEVFVKAPGPCHSRDVEAYRDAIHRYARILRGAPEGCGMG